MALPINKHVTNIITGKRLANSGSIPWVATNKLKLSAVKYVDRKKAAP
jgi:hypothetical protein